MLVAAMSPQSSERQLNSWACLQEFSVVPLDFADVVLGVVLADSMALSAVTRLLVPPTLFECVP